LFIQKSSYGEIMMRVLKSEQQEDSNSKIIRAIQKPEKNKLLSF
jgi:hypothetical protein